MVQSQDFYGDSFRSEGSQDCYGQSMRSAASGSTRDFYSSSRGESFRGNRSHSTIGHERRGRRRGDQRGPVNNSLSSGTSEYTDYYTRDEDPIQSSGVYSMASESAYFDTAPSSRDINQARREGMPKFRPPLRGAESQSVDASPFSSENQQSLLNDQAQSLRSFGSNLIGLEEEEGYYRDQNPQGPDDGMVDNIDDFADQDEEEDLPPSPLRQLLDAINMSILPSSLRLSSLSQAVEFFDHRDRAMHDAELREGAAFVLYHKLGLILKLSKSSEMERIHEISGSSSTSVVGGGMGESSSRKPGGSNHYMMAHYNTTAHIQQQSEHDKEIAMVCSCLEMVHRADPDAIAQTWDECGTEILPLLVAVLERPFNKIEHAVWSAIREKANVPGSLERAVAMAVTRDQKLAVQKVTKVLAMYSLVPEAKKPMCECEGMLRWLTRIIDTHNYNRVKPGAPIIGGTVAAGGIKAPFVEPTVSNSNKPEDAETKRVARLALASRATSGSGLYMTEAARFNTIATLTNLAALESNRMPMISEPGLIDNICRAVHNERSDVPKQCSALAIMNLSNGDPDHVPEMASNDLVLETLLKLMREDNPETRRNAVVTIFNVACSDANTVKLARYRDGTILEALTELVGADDPFRLHDEARSNAAETLFNMSCSEISETTDRMANHAGLLECLAVTLRGEHTGLEVKMYCAATLRRMSELIRHPMIAQGALLSALVKAATWTSTDCIAEAFRAQATVPENCVIMANHHGLLNALSRLALAQGEDSDIEKVRMAAVGAIELMSRQDDARELLAHNEGIMMALTRASYGEGARASIRRSTLSEVDKSHVSQASYGEDQSRVKDGDSDDDSIQSRRIQVALKNLVSAM
mmetsp:Transcript_31715/g.67211  ORF Transcript_31715/g.67211 Transcript_31715/m.67211 type:complete len:869 (-) Transcript_31715:218-2824(-)|eukprot:CAMPEP_0171342664 /NCGR_PEP_ID=MMETSP0878-20121228/15114_1 /TAXON_ID=67004 /ORGANISM="Thalassiosira weissflogii, Strain CCMP1336" /LENGTH=868 /DNA_ID=CAMNT_0011845407 /DNA_START=51 /DNA_END=2657 /DNA_ORIENTATION=+